MFIFTLFLNSNSVKDRHSKQETGIAFAFEKKSSIMLYVFVVCLASLYLVSPSFDVPDYSRDVLCGTC